MEFTPLLKQQSFGARPVLGFAGSASVAFAHRQNSASPVADTSGAETNSGIHFYHHELFASKVEQICLQAAAVVHWPFPGQPSPCFSGWAACPSPELIAQPDGRISGSS
jgi:hypothetical protein